ncbi:hypothetical protein PF1270 [Pyrococcus furiosus DSM 3638]|nr:hypothetical protein PF1270 [Pyrococcus furiosus DSM 3638]AFN04054.1 hypothetical protein PFC_05565 [Pyrococcus furiosus COM1]
MGDTPEEVSELVLSTLNEFSIDLREILEINDYPIKITVIDTWEKVRGDRIIVLPYSELTDDGSLYFLKQDLEEAMDNPDLEKLKLLAWEMLVSKVSYLLYKNFEEIRSLNNRNDIAILASLLTTTTLLSLDDIKTIAATLEAKISVIKEDLESVDVLFSSIDVLRYDEQEAVYNEVRMKVIRAGAQFLDASIINWMFLQAITLAPLIDPKNEIKRLIKERVFSGDLSKKLDEVFSGIWAFYDLIKIVGKGRFELVELRDKILEYRQRLGLEFYPSTQDFFEKATVI